MASDLRGPLAEGRSHNAGEGGRSCPQGSAASEESILVADLCAQNVWALDPRDGAIVGAISEAGRKPVDVGDGDGLIHVVSMPDEGSPSSTSRCSKR